MTMKRNYLDTLVHTARLRRPGSWCSYDKQDLHVPLPLVQKDAAEAFKEAVGKHYEEAAGCCSKLLYC